MTKPRFEIFQDSAAEWRFRLAGRNGEIVATSEGYTSKAYFSGTNVRSD